MAKKFDRPKHKQESLINKAKKSIKVDHNDFISFSFKYFDEHHKKFHLNEKELDYFLILLNRLKDISTLLINLIVYLSMIIITLAIVRIVLI